MNYNYRIYQIQIVRILGIDFNVKIHALLTLTYASEGFKLAVSPEEETR